MMTEIQCQYRSVSSDGTPLCQVVRQLTGLSITLCHTNDSACQFCLSCGIPPDTPNRATASMATHAAMRSGEPPGGPIARRMVPVLIHAAPPSTLANTACVLRGPQIREQACKPCQAGGLKSVLVPVYRCPKHGECTIKNTGAHPKIAACITCQERQAEYPMPQMKPYPPEIVAVLNKK